MFTRIRRFAVRLAAVCLLVVVLSGAGHLVLSPGTDTTSPAGEAVTALTAGTFDSEGLPDGFEERMDYRPDGAAKPDGSCSAGGMDYPRFDAACRTHDLGYDLLRFASRTRGPLGPWARLAIDRRFHGDMVEACDTVGCLVLAHVYGFAVGVNSLRQGFMAPTEEPGGRWAMVGVLAVATAAARSSPAWHRRTRVGRTSPPPRPVPHHVRSFVW